MSLETCAPELKTLVEDFTRRYAPIFGASVPLNGRILSVPAVSYALAPLRWRLRRGEELNDMGRELIYATGGYLAAIATSYLTQTEYAFSVEAEKLGSAKGRLQVTLTNGYSQDFFSDLLLTYLDGGDGQAVSYGLSRYADDDFWYLLDVLRLASPLARCPVDAGVTVDTTLLAKVLRVELIEDLSLTTTDDTALAFVDAVVAALLEHPGRTTLVERATHLIQSRAKFSGTGQSFEDYLAILSRSTSAVTREVGIVSQLICGYRGYVLDSEVAPCKLNLGAVAFEKWQFLGNDGPAPYEFTEEIVADWECAAEEIVDSERGPLGDSLFEHYDLLPPIRVQERQELAAALLAKYPNDERARVVLAHSLVVGGIDNDGEKLLRTIINGNPKYPEAHLTYVNTLLVSGRSNEARQVLHQALELWPNKSELLELACEFYVIGCTQQSDCDLVINVC